ncbi:hypothetical protein M8J76_000909, partial [Diaphorina citri]
MCHMILWWLVMWRATCSSATEPNVTDVTLGSTPPSD